MKSLCLPNHLSCLFTHLFHIVLCLTNLRFLPIQSFVCPIALSHVFSATTISVSSNFVFRAFSPPFRLSSRSISPPASFLRPFPVYLSSPRHFSGCSPLPSLCIAARPSPQSRFPPGSRRPISGCPSRLRRRDLSRSHVSGLTPRLRQGYPHAPIWFPPPALAPLVPRDSAAPVLNMDEAGKPLTFRSAMASPFRAQWIDGDGDELIKIVETTRTLTPVHFPTSSPTYYNRVVKEKWSPSSVLLPGPPRSL